MSQPAVSVLMAVRDGGEYLPATLASLVAQTLTDFELILVDDASDAPTQAEIARWRTADSRIRVIRNDTQSGLPVSLNRGLEHCRAPLVARADADDLYAPDRLARQVAHFEAHPRVGVLSSGFHRIDAAGRRIDTRRAITGHARIRFRMLFMNSLLHPGAMFRAELVRTAGGYDPDYWTAQDSDLWARLLPFTRLDNLPDPLVSYRIHARSIMRTRGDAGRGLSLSVPGRLQAAYLGRTPSESEVRATVDTFQSFQPLDSATVDAGARGLNEILARASACEEPAILADFCNATARALTRQARWRLGAEPAAAATLAARAARWRLRGVAGQSRMHARQRPEPSP